MHIPTIHHFQKLFLWLSIFFMILQLWYEIMHSSKNNFSEGENNVVFVLDVSQSMNVKDVWNYNRLDSAKRKIIDIMNQVQGNNFALNIFAGESLRILPFTTDIDLVSTFLLWVDNRNITKQGSNISWALITAIESFSPDQSGTVVLLTDGTDDNININSEIKNLYTQQKIQLIILWVWTQEGWYIPSNNPLNPYKIYNWNVVIARLNRDSLRSVADTISGIYFDMNAYQDYSKIWQWSSENKFPYIFILFLISWMLYMLCLYQNVFSKRYYTWNIK